MINGRVDHQLDSATIEKALSLIDELSNLLPFLVRLKASEKSSLVRPHPAAAQVVNTISELSEKLRLPVDVSAMRRDMSVFEGLERIASRLQSLSEDIDDTRFLAGSESWNAALIARGMLASLARQDPEIERALSSLQPLITSRGRRSASPPPPSPSP